MALKYWLEAVNSQRPWANGALAIVMVTNDAVPTFSPMQVPCPPITAADLVTKTAAMPGSPLRDIAAAICSDKLGVTVATEPPA